MFVERDRLILVFVSNVLIDLVKQERDEPRREHRKIGVRDGSARGVEANEEKPYSKRNTDQDEDYEVDRSVIIVGSRHHDELDGERIQDSKSHQGGIGNDAKVIEETQQGRGWIA